jgi:hypothetical protein
VKRLDVCGSASDLAVYSITTIEKPLDCLIRDSGHYGVGIMRTSNYGDIQLTRQLSAC